MINTLFQEVANNWIEDKEHAETEIKKNKLYNKGKPESERKKFPFTSLASSNLICKELPEKLFTKCNLDENEHLIKGSIGNGNISDVPWICIFDKDITDTAQEGYYLVYLFDAQMKKVYLSLNQGWTKYKESYGTKLGRNKVSESSETATKLLTGITPYSFESIDLLSKKDLAIGYELANICSISYNLSSMPTEAELINDLEKLLEVYKVLKEFLKKGVLDLEPKVSETDYQEKSQKGKVKKLKKGRVEKKNKKPANSSSSWYRDPDMSYTALNNARFECEVDRSHKTFVSQKTKKQFVEAHHLIPMKFQDIIEVSIDVPENIVSLCPNCHRAFHNSTPKKKLELIEKFYNDRETKLREREIYINLKQLKDYYKA